MTANQLEIVIQPIEPAQTYALRHAVLWPDKPLAYVQLPDDVAGQHYGAFVAGALVAVISLFVAADGVARFRKFATDPAWQGRGVGTALLQYVIGAARAQGASQLWCDARQNTLPFYQRFGLAPEGAVFYKGEVPYVRLNLALS
ncbi:GNAT family N-acetyltransferase [Hymenobacter ginsengisoli]|uniref:GNAT family N-acetyltransferase n=1 Tax=Hymenobacter ginsengisoli TaxID=1051626 RepID=A0ABP8Q633_9BACT|nr:MULTISPECIES: GNAT family N-acetyltransferase [unclassified Hymenobacter]MBO2031757.1 GNAT family N-acetyltransferase [Hymenobacter sp. BT559]